MRKNLYFNIKAALLGLFVLCQFLLTVQTHAKTSDNKSTLEEVSKKYRDAKLVEMPVTKTIKSEVLGKESIFDGKIFLSAGKFRWDVDKPEKSSIIFDGKFLWNIQFPKTDKETIQISQAKVDKRNKSQMLVGVLFGSGSINNQVKVISEKANGEFIDIDAVPLGTDVNVKNLKIKIDANKKIIVEISYLDDLENQTILKFNDSIFKKETMKSLFNYTPPKGAKVTKI